MNPPEVDPALQRLFDRDARLKRELENPWQDEIDLAGARPLQIGLTAVYADLMGRLWVYVDPLSASEKLQMIFDPNWLHPLKRWSGGRIDTRRHPPKKD